MANGLKQIKAEHGAAAASARWPARTARVEELYLLAKLVRGLGSENIDHRLRHADFADAAEGVPLAGHARSPRCRTLQRALVIGSFLRKDHPLFALRLRGAVRKRRAGHRVLHDADDDWAMPVAQRMTRRAERSGLQALADVAAAVGAEQGRRGAGRRRNADATPPRPSPRRCWRGERKAILLGNAAAHHPQAASLLALAQWIGEQTGATRRLPDRSRQHRRRAAGRRAARARRAERRPDAGRRPEGLLLLNTEPEFDSAAGAAGRRRARPAPRWSSTLSPFKANLDFTDVLLPIAPFTETPGTFVNAEGRVQSFHAVVKPLGETRPAWKVLRVLGNLLGLPGFDYESAQPTCWLPRAAPHDAAAAAGAGRQAEQRHARQRSTLARRAARARRSTAAHLPARWHRAPRALAAADRRRARRAAAAGAGGRRHDRHRSTASATA